MQDFLVVAMLDSQRDLSEPVEKFIFRHVVLPALPISSLESLLDLALEVSIVCIVHHDTQLALLRLVDFAELHDIGMVEDFENFGLV